MLKTYYQLAKPGIVYGNLLTIIGGFLYASGNQVDVLLLLAIAVGTSLVIASGCVFNNYLDRDIDAKMRRTQKRALVIADVSTKNALIYGAVLGTAGVAILALYTNFLTLLIGLTGFVSYVFLYTYLKRKTVYGTLIGTIPGATPLIAGYTAVTGHIDLDALLLFLIMIAWQMPHFYAIAIYRLSDYRAAGLPVYPVVYGIKAAKIQITAYILLFIAATSALTGQGRAGFSYLIVMLGLGLYWLWLSLKSFDEAGGTELWARRIFKHSLFVILGFSLMISLDSLLP